MSAFEDDQIILRFQWATEESARYIEYPRQALEQYHAQQARQSPPTPSSSLSPGSQTSTTSSIDMKEIDVKIGVDIRNLIQNPAKAGRACRIRLLAVEQTEWRPIGFQIKVDTYRTLRDSFHLSNTTLYTFSNISGTCYHALHLKQTTTQNAKPEGRIDIVIKANQKHEVANYGLSLSYDTRTETTTALLYGCHVIEPCRTYTQNELKPQLQQLCAHIEAMQDLWRHPLILPVALLLNHFERLAYRANIELDEKVLEIEKSLGQTWAGRLRSGCPAFAHTPRFAQPLRITDTAFTLPDFSNITKEVNTTLTELIQLNRCAEWELELIEFLKNILQNPEYASALGKLGEDHRQKLEEILSYYTYSVKAISARIAELRVRAETQLQVLYSLINQHEAAAMKGLAVITFIFLPASTVATVFSMGVFQWQPGTGLTLLPDFWKFWAAAIPLTLFVVICWTLWLFRMRVRRWLPLGWAGKRKQM